jgi:hypothetical protein
VSVEQQEIDKKDNEHRTLVNLVAVIAILVLAIGAIWVMRELDQSRKIEQCLEMGRRDCGKLNGTPDAPPQR